MIVNRGGDWMRFTQEWVVECYWLELWIQSMRDLGSASVVKAIDWVSRWW